MTVVVCTGRQAHDKTEALLRMFRVVSSQPREFQPFELASADLSHVNMAYVRHIEARCTVCGLGPKKIGQRQLEQIINSGLAEADISLLPF